MNKPTQSVGGAAMTGLFPGSSTGMAMQGTAYNGAVVFGPSGAFIGWLISRNSKKSAIDSPLEPSSSNESDAQAEDKTEMASNLGASAAGVFISALAILAAVWNFHIDLLKVTRLLPIFQEKPWLFIVLGVVVSAFLPPFLPVCLFAIWVLFILGQDLKTDIVLR